MTVQTRPLGAIFATVVRALLPATPRPLPLLRAFPQGDRPAPPANAAGNQRRCHNLRAKPGWDWPVATTLVAGASLRALARLGKRRGRRQCAVAAKTDVSRATTVSLQGEANAGLGYATY